MLYRADTPRLRSTTQNICFLIPISAVILKLMPQGPEEMCLSLEHQNPSKTCEKWVILIALQFRYTFYIPQTKRLRARKIGLQYKIRKACPLFLLGTSCLGRATSCAPARLWLAVIDFQNGERQSRSGSEKKRSNRLQ